MTNEEKVFELLEASGLNWSVGKIPLIPSIEGYSHDTESFGLFKEDTGEHLHTVGRQYQILQNSEMADMMMDAAHTLGLTDKVRAGSLANSKKVYIQFGLDDTMIAGDTIKRHVTALNIHGTGSVGFGSTNTVVVCQNTFHQALKEVGSRFRHSANVKENLENAITGLMLSISSDEKLMGDFRRMASVEMEEKHMIRTIADVFGLKVKTSADLQALVPGENISTRKANVMGIFANVMKKELASHGNSVWGLFNSVTYYTNHILPKKKESLDYVMDGAGAETNSRVFASLMEMV